MNDYYDKPKRYFLNDEELTSFDNDILNRRDIVNSLKLIIENANPHCNIALIGKWGTGKSSIINLLLDEYKNNTEKYTIQKINAWKNKDKNLNDVFIEESLRNLNVKNTDFKSDVSNDSIKQDNNVLYGNLNSKLNEKSNNKWKNLGRLIIESIGHILQVLAISVIVSFIIFIVYSFFRELNTTSGIDSIFVETTLQAYFEDFASILFWPLLLATIWKFATLIKENKTILANKYEISVKSEDDITTAIQQNLSNNKDRRFITIIEDIDRLSINEIIKKLDEIKNFEDFENCIFVIPFDDFILKKALYLKRISSIDEASQNIESKLILDKLFQYKIYMPPFLNLNIKDYAVNLVEQNIPDFIAEYCKIGQFEDVVKKILVHKNVTNPRQVKKIINNFVNNKIIMTNRVKRGDIPEEIVSSDYDFNYKLAKISVLQAEYSEFYNLLFKNDEYINKIVEICNSDVKSDDIDEEIKPFFKCSSNGEHKIVNIKKRYKGLISFLNETSQYDVKDILKLMYLSDAKSAIHSENLTNELSGLPEKNNEEFNKNELQENCKYNSKKNNHDNELQQIKTLDTPENKEFIEQLINMIVNEYKANPQSEIYFDFTAKIIKSTKKHVDAHAYTKFIKTLASNLEYYPSEGLQILKALKGNIPNYISKILLHKSNEIVNKDIYEDCYQVLQKNSDCFYDEKEDLSEYVRFLVDNIALSENPNAIIQELDENFNRISKIYELNKNIKNAKNIDNNIAYEFLAKCLDNGPLNRMIIDINNILEDEDGAQDCLNIESKMQNYKLTNVIKNDVKSLQNNEEYYNYNMLKNLIFICANKKADITAEQVLEFLKEIFYRDNISEDITHIDNAYSTDIIEEDFDVYNNKDYVLSIYEILKQFDRMYFYDLRKEFIDVLYSCFHNTNIEELKIFTIECAKYFKVTLLLRNRLDENELKIYLDNK